MSFTVVGCLAGQDKAIRGNEAKFGTWEHSYLRVDKQEKAGEDYRPVGGGRGAISEEIKERSAFKKGR